jgi:hypothetical protein
LPQLSAVPLGSSTTMTRKSQTADEFQVFQKFSKHYPGGLLEIENRIPPEPDIRAKTKSGEQLAFEIVEFIDQEFAREGYGLPRLEVKLRQAYQALAVYEKNELKKMFHRFYIFVHFSENSSMREREKAVPEVFNLAKLLHPKVTSEFNARLGDFKSIIIRRINFFESICDDGPYWKTQAGGLLGDPTERRLIEKFNKRYKTDAKKIELVGFFRFQPGPFKWFFPEIEAFAKLHIQRSDFSAVWIYSEKSDKIEMTINK